MVGPAGGGSRRAGEWNVGRMVVRGTTIQNWLNGKKVVDISAADTADRTRQKRERFFAAFSEIGAKELHVEIVDWGTGVIYRGIKLRTKPARKPPSGRGEVTQKGDKSNY